jgi:hypothetical protein
LLYERVLADESLDGLDHAPLPQNADSRGLENAFQRLESMYHLLHQTQQHIQQGLEKVGVALKSLDPHSQRF